MTTIAFATSGLLALLMWVAIACVVVWAIHALVQWIGIPIPAPVRIVFLALVCIFLIVLMFRAFTAIL